MGRRCSSHLHVRTFYYCAVCIPSITRFHWRTHARVSSTDLAACTLRAESASYVTISVLSWRLLSRCCFPSTSRLARTARRHLKARHRRRSPGTTPQYAPPDRHLPHARPSLCHTPSRPPATAARDPETPSVPGHTISHARSHVSKAWTYRPTRPSGSGFTPAQRTSRLDHQTIRIIRLNGSAACADPMLHCILLLPRPSDNYYHCAAAHTAA